MKNEIMSAALASMILGFGGFIFAQSQDSSEKNTEKEAVHKELQKPLELEIIEGKIKVYGKDRFRIITINTESRDSHVLAVIASERKNRPPKSRKPYMSGVAGAFEKPEGRGGDFSRDRNEEMPKFVTMNDLAQLKGKTVRLKGIMNKETNIFTVFEIDGSEK